MSGSGRFAFARSHTGDRFYNPPPMRRHQQQLLQQQQQQQKQNQFQRPTTPITTSIESDNRTDSDDSLSSKPSVCSSLSNGSTNSTNLDRFLESITPSVPAQSLSKTSMKVLRADDSEFYPYFTLGDLWESYKEWSAYGAGVPLVLNGSDSVVQYYVPYLSGIQLYVDPLKPPSFRSSRPGEESDADSSRETSSDGSECDLERQSKHVPEGMWTKQNSTELCRPLMEASGDDGEVGNPPGQMIFQYMEQETPYHRKPLADKISVLASRFPELKAYKSCDLLPSSWMSVAWYPIYRIPTGQTLRDLDACFLTFHSLSTPSRNGTNFPQQGLASTLAKFNGMTDPKLSLPVFGLASYKFKGSVWTPNGLYERQRASSLLQAADNWLRLLQVNHPDYSFFVSHNAFRR